MDADESVPISMVAQPNTLSQVTNQTISTQTSTESCGINTDMSPPRKAPKMIAQDQGNQANLSFSILPSCGTCGKVFKNSSQLSQHMLVHSNERKYKCSYCDKAFKQMSHVQQHTRMHTGEKPYKCKVEGCDKGFAQMANLHHHMRSHEKDSSPVKTEGTTTADSTEWHSCDECDNQFNTSRGLACHKQKAHTKYDPSKAGVITPSPVKSKRKRGASPKGRSSSSYQDQHNEVSSSTSAVGSDNYSSLIKRESAASIMNTKHAESSSQVYTARGSSEETVPAAQPSNQGQGIKLPTIAHISPPRVSSESHHISPRVSSEVQHNSPRVSSESYHISPCGSSELQSNSPRVSSESQHFSPAGVGSELPHVSPRVSSELPHIPASDVISALQQ
ncbi:hypothetical protein FSP39_011000 [Pinctada imbricata]|uniref:C2H2-type domain-containing protein n=1 Tax=Pinctada imbricata TaxID=66713 RepID=A0AA88YGQ0_PINIB|nr:hypothetical protein FSP39_011000 [Pinctada imbricata]